MSKFVILIVILLMASSVRAATITEPQGVEVNISWTMPPDNTNGKPLTNLGGVVLYCGPEPGKYTVSKKLGLVTSFNAQIKVRWFCALKAYNTLGVLSEYSKEVCKDPVVECNPSPPIPCTPPSKLNSTGTN